VVGKLIFSGEVRTVETQNLASQYQEDTPMAAHAVGKMQGRCIPDGWDAAPPHNLY
jgi:hypothetical protein